MATKAAHATPANDEYQYSSYSEDLLGRGKKKKDKKANYSGSESEEEEDDKTSIYLFYDFRRGADNFPEGIEVRVLAQQSIVLQREAINPLTVRNAVSSKVAFDISVVGFGSQSRRRAQRKSCQRGF